ncbi:hypothetical protein QAD02_005124 [Eretmocerus hayati]|uniref:Uncharacterized protein n=1 Tax=Eretmocerus hayati TaxID=131215 RepID=A0ACC2NRZ4_9HYME|nr:hypothetical protein QAD02_005124 [Eretmocerus hayati]
MSEEVAMIIRLVASCVSAAAKAGEIIRDVKSRGELNIVEKKKDDYQTEADRSAQRCIVASLNKRFPDVKVIGEEELPNQEILDDWVVTNMDSEVMKVHLPSELQNIKAEDLCIWVDPLDGTREYVQGTVEQVTVLIGVAVKDKAVAGVIHQPYFKNSQDGSLGRTLWGIDSVGIGGFKLCPPPDGKRIITTTKCKFRDEIQAALDAFEPDGILRVNGAGYKVLQLLDGKAHAYFYANRGYMRWDTCAPEAILYAAGGKFTDLRGDRYSYVSTTSFPNRRGVLATAPGQDHEWYLDRIPSEIKMRETD